MESIVERRRLLVLQQLLACVLNLRMWTRPSSLFSLDSLLMRSSGLSGNSTERRPRSGPSLVAMSVPSLATCFTPVPTLLMLFLLLLLLLLLLRCLLLLLPPLFPVWLFGLLALDGATEGPRRSRCCSSLVRQRWSRRRASAMPKTSSSVLVSDRSWASKAAPPAWKQSSAASFNSSWRAHSESPAGAGSRSGGGSCWCERSQSHLHRSIPRSALGGGEWTLATRPPHRQHR
mmetsp:Transcript_75804/g.158017  ORF Transcript_75804/g.158017 Transcript_75804/m.158017 type:complete len:232 (+) Transcript_75804:962-1657(+)